MRSSLIVLLLLTAPLAIVSDAGAQGSEGELARLAPGVEESLENGSAVVYLTHVRGANPGAASEDLDALGLDQVVLPHIGVTQVLADRADVERLRALPWVSSVHPDRAIEFALNDAAPLANATGAWQDLGVRGAGVRVLVIDTGVDALHPDLEDRILVNVQAADPLDSGLVPLDYHEGVPFNDEMGHGTPVTGIIAGTGEALGEQDPSHATYIGIAPEADIVSWGIFSPYGFMAQALQGFEYALENQERFGFRLITNSYGGFGGAHDPEDPFNVASLEAYKAGMAVLFAAGNDGQPDACEEVWINSFGNMPWALNIGATDKQARLWPFSSTGMDPRDCGEVWTHPTLVAPGAAITATKSRAGWIHALDAVAGPDPMERDLVAQATHYSQASGTSFAAPMVAGVLALLLEANPELSPAQAYDILVETAVPLAEARPYWQAGAGMVDAGAAVEQALATDGELDAFLAGDQPYTDWEDPLDEPLRSFLVENEPAGLEASALTEFLDAEGLSGIDEDLDALAEEGGRSTPGPGVWVLLATLVAALTWRRRP